MPTVPENAEAFQIKVQLDEVRNKFLRHFRVSAESLTHSYHAIKNYQADFLPVLEMDSLPFLAQDPSVQLDWEALRQQTMNWLLKNAFEDFVTGLNESLIEAYRFLHYRNAAHATRQRPFRDKEALEQQLQGIESQPMSLHVPKLIDAIAEEINAPIQLVPEILSINKVRNCLVHRNGVVSALDINDKENNSLRLTYLDHIVHVKIDGQPHRLTMELKLTSPTVHGIMLEARPTTRSFALGERVTFDTNLFNSVAFTCMSFTEQLLHQLWLIVQRDREAGLME
ncbi:MAG: hypothetical protein IPK70_00065 [Flavobacteriales bacterium]|nr:hypothetical protein [Flavobacteriales bacterium]MBK8225550.1 hypothetical protein [Flavobacteriales bacterium]